MDCFGLVLDPAFTYAAADEEGPLVCARSGEVWHQIKGFGPVWGALHHTER